MVAWSQQNFGMSCYPISFLGSILKGTNVIHEL